MKIGMICDIHSPQKTYYPLIRGDMPLFQEFVKMGHELVLLQPSVSTNTYNKWIATPSAFHDYFTNCIKLVEHDNYEKEAENCDIILITTMPVLSYYWRYRRLVNPFVEKLINSGKPVFVRTCDDEGLDKTRQSYIFDFYLKRGLLDKIKYLFVADKDNINGYPCTDKLFWLPQVYPTEFEIPFNPNKKYAWVHTGPIGQRYDIIKAMRKAIESTGLPGKIYGTGYDSKYYRKGELSLSHFDEGTVQSVEKRLFTDYNTYLKIISEGCFSFHSVLANHYIEKELIPSSHTARLFEGVAAGLPCISGNFIPRNFFSTIIKEDDLTTIETIVKNNLYEVVLAKQREQLTTILSPKMWASKVMEVINKNCN